MTENERRRSTMESVLQLAKTYAEIRDMIIDRTKDTTFVLSEESDEKQVSAMRELRRVTAALREDLMELLDVLWPAARTSEGIDVSIKHGHSQEETLGLPVPEKLNVQIIYSSEPEHSTDVDEVGTTDLVFAARAVLTLQTNRIETTSFTIKLDTDHLPDSD